MTRSQIRFALLAALTATRCSLLLVGGSFWSRPMAARSPCSARIGKAKVPGVLALRFSDATDWSGRGVDACLR